MKKLYLLLIAVLFAVLPVAAQNMTVSGTVMSEADGEPVIGATVKAKGSSHGTTTDINGHFQFQVPKTTKTIVFSYVGMKTTEVPVSAVMNVEMESDAQQLDEVVVTGYGQTRKAAFTGAASIVSGNIIDKKPDVNFVKSLEGNVTGFQYNNSTSMPGQWGSVYVRGLGTLSSGSQPLYVIDGMPVNSDYDSMGENNNYFDPMAAYNPNDIESVTVLKDAAATAIYGSRAANGVIVITTKHGSEGKFNLTLDVKQGFTRKANNNMKYANARQTMDLWARGYATRTGQTIEAAESYLTNYFDWDGVSSYDWIGAISRTGYYQDYNVNFSGTNGTTHYYVALGYLDTEGILIGSDNLRYSGRVNVDTKYKAISAGINANYAWSRNNAFSQSTGGSMSSPSTAAVSSMTPFDPFYVNDGRDYNPINYNPLAVMDPELGDLNEVKNQTINANPWLRIDLPFGIWVKTSFGANIMDQRQYQYWSAVYNPQGKDYNGLGQQYNSNTTTLTWTNTLGWDYTINEKHNIDLLFGQEMQRRNFWYEYYSGNDFPFADSGMRDFSTCANIDSGEYFKSERRLASYFANAQYSYDNRYYLSGSFRRDGSSVFGANNRWGNFWSVGAKWRMSEESFLKGNEIITNAALRASYGTVGNQDISSSAARGYYSAGYNYHSVAGMVPANISNPNLTWETSKKFDVGFDLSFINRWHLTFDFYNDDTSDALYEVPLSFTTGLSSSYQNIGKIRNRGIEFGVNGTAFTNKDVTVNVFANITHNKNKVIKLANGTIESAYTIIEEGRPYHQFYMKEYAGYDHETGKPLWYANAEGDETTGDYTVAAKRYVGSSDPKVFGAFGFNAQGYGFDASMQFNYRLGAKVFDSAASFTGWGMQFRTPLEKVALGSWTPENTDAPYPRYVYGDPDMSTQRSTRFLMNANYLRLSNITLGYTLPAKLTRKAYIQKARFYINMDNVHTWTSDEFTGYNPDTYASGVIAWQYPAVFTFTGGVQVTF